MDIFEHSIVVDEEQANSFKQLLRARKLTTSFTMSVLQCDIYMYAAPSQGGYEALCLLDARGPAHMHAH